MVRMQSSAPAAAARKAKICFMPEPVCDPAICRYAKGFYDRSDAAVTQLLATGTMSRAAIEAVARIHDVCPFELSLEAAVWADVVICDYNYVFDPVVRLYVDMSDPEITELDVPPHFTNIQHGLQVSRRLLAGQDTPNRRVILITDGLPTAHFEDNRLYLLYPPHRRTEEATLREGQLCARERITINIFLLPTWSQSREDVQFAHRMAETTKGRVFFTAGRDLDRYVVWDYVNRRRQIIS